MEILSLGSKGPEVARLQRRLNELGYRNSIGAMLADDGKFGPMTQQVVNVFKDEVLPDGNRGGNRGIVGATTWEHLDKAKAILTPNTFWLPPFDLNDGGRRWTDKDIKDFIEFEEGNKLTWDGCTSTLLKVRDNFESVCGRRGWDIRYTSAYRPIIYQAHFWDICKGAASETIIGKAHCQKHGVRSASRPNRFSSTHIMGIAFDAVISAGGQPINPAGRAINADLLRIANAVGLKTPPVNDTIHFELEVR